MTPTAAQLIESHGLAPHPEGGFYRETYRDARLLPASALPGFSGPRPASTAIHFLLPRGARSRLHRLKSDEVWHFHLGGPLHIVSIAPDGAVADVVLGADAASGERLQHAVPAGHWFGAYPDAAADYAFVGCTVAPGFDFADFELGRRAELLRLFPAARATVELLTEARDG